jgi:hypothetical protein
MSEPYALYAISSVGSLVALLAYPFLIEPFITVSDQINIWRSFLILIATMITGGALLLYYANKQSPTFKTPTDNVSLIPVLCWPLWVALAAITCAVMLAATQLIIAEIGSVPLAWVGPMGVYLGSFALIFSGRWRTWMTGTSIVGLALSLAAFMALRGFGSATISGHSLVALVACCGFACLAGHSLLHASRPERSGEWFYMALAIGGAVGGLASIWVTPIIFPRPVEFGIGAATILAVSLFWGSRWRHVSVASACLALSLGPILILGVTQINADRLGDGVLTHYRDVYGSLVLKTDPISVVLSSANTTHGTQMNESVEGRRRPTLYYTESSPIGRAITALQMERPSLRIAAIGLGAGTIAAYARPSDQIIFYDIDPKIESIARTYFSYLADSDGDIRVYIADGRRALANTEDDFDLVFIDAFTGGGIPAHLGTREALEIFQNRVHARNGFIVFHASLRYSRLYPILATTARTLHMESLEVNTVINNSLDDQDWDPANSTYVLLGSTYHALAWENWFPLDEDEGRVTRELRRELNAIGSFNQIWTDERSASLDVLSLPLWLTR